MNPVLPGFHPDPSIVRVDETFYLATSTFEWFPGVALYYSHDLLSWHHVPAPLASTGLIDLIGVPDSGGVWAPCLTHDGDRFFLTYSNVRAHGGIFQDCHNYVTTAPAITGPWSEPVFLHSYGADPSLVHVRGANGRMRRYVIGTRSEALAGQNPFGGIILHELDAERLTVLHPEREQIIFSGTALGCTEGPHIYQRGGWFYLLTAEGGTGYDHAVTVARSRSIEGPYEVHPDNPLLTSAGDKTLELQRAGHGDLVEAADGRWFLAHLCSRIPSGVPYTDRYSPLGRETAVQEVRWDNDEWPRLASGGRYPVVSFPPVRSGQRNNPAVPVGPDRFGGDGYGELPPWYLSPRVPFRAYADVQDDGLHVRGGESPRSLHHHHLIARRVQHLNWQAETRVRIQPHSSRHMAGLMVWYNREAWHYLLVTTAPRGAFVTVLSRIGGGERWSEHSIDLPDNVRSVAMQASSDSRTLRVRVKPEHSAEWASLGNGYDLFTLSDERVPLGGFTGTFVGMACHDLAGLGREAVFEYLSYSEA